jgi:hypothetical protein
LTPGLFTEVGPHVHGAAKLCREYLDKARPAFLFNWNPKKYTPEGAEFGHLGFKPGQRTEWRCQTTHVRVGDPVYLLRLGTKHSKGIVAKARICSEAFTGRDWVEGDDSAIRYVLIEFEEVRDHPRAAGITTEHLKTKFPDQHWSPQQSGIEIKPEICQELHELWRSSGAKSSILEMFERYNSENPYADWIEKYREITRAVAKAKVSGEVSDELLHRIWRMDDNGIGRAGRGCLTDVDYDAAKNELRGLLMVILDDPSEETYDATVQNLQALKKQGLIKWMPWAVTNRVFAAVNPQKLTSIVNDWSFRALNDVLVERFGMTEPPSRKWLHVNAHLHAFLKEQGVDDSDAIIFNTFCWYLITQLTGESSIKADELDEEVTGMSKNLILYGPPGTGKTYALKSDYFPKYTSESYAQSQDEWQDDIIEDLTWHETIAAAMHESESPSIKVSDLMEHPYIRAKSRLNNRTRNIGNTIWAQLQSRTSDECPNVNLQRRNDPRWFWKDDDSSWRLIDEWAETRCKQNQRWTTRRRIGQALRIYYISSVIQLRGVCRRNSPHANCRRH